MTTGVVESLRYDSNEKKLQIIDQLVLPHVTRWIQIESVEDGWMAIRNMNVRGAPAIAIVAMLSLAVDLYHRTRHSDNIIAEKDNRLVGSSAAAWVREKLEYLKTSRPTAVNLFEACARLESILSQGSLVELVVQFAETMLAKDVADNRLIGDHGAAYIRDKNKEFPMLRVLTHCNTGALATAGYGTALGVIRSLHASSSLAQVFCTETRPYNQGSRLTAYELVKDGLPGATLVTDSMVAFLLSQQAAKDAPIHAIIVGADRIAANGDTANKIGTYQLALCAKYHKVLFIVAAPTTTIDMAIPNGLSIPIEQRPANEMKMLTGMAKDGQLTSVSLCPPDIQVWNPSFDVTPAHLIDAIVTELGVITRQPSDSDTFDIAEFLDGFK